VHCEINLDNFLLITNDTNGALGRWSMGALEHFRFFPNAPFPHFPNAQSIVANNGYQNIFHSAVVHCEISFDKLAILCYNLLQKNEGDNNV
jgi:hypothetical protein